MTRAELKQEARRMADQGMTMAEIARRLRLPYGTVQEWISRRIETSRTNPELATRPPAERYRICDPVLALAMSGAWR